MIVRFAVPAALLLAAMPAAAQEQAAPSESETRQLSAQEAAVRDAAMAFGQCVSTGVQGVAATATPEAGASSVIAGCAAQRQALEQAANALIDTLPAEEQAAARERVRTGLARAETQVADALRQQRAAPAPEAEPAQ